MGIQWAYSRFFEGLLLMLLMCEHMTVASVMAD